MSRPQAICHRVTESRPHQQYDHGLVEHIGDGLDAREPLCQPRAQQVPHHEGQQQHLSDLEHGGAHVQATSVMPHDQAHQQRREEHAQQSRQGGVEHRRRHVPACQGCHRHRRRHRGRQHRQVEKAHQQVLRDPRPQRERAQRPPQGKENIGAGLHQHVQLPAAGAGLEVVGRQTHAVQEEQQEHAHVGDPSHVQRAFAAAPLRHQRRQHHRRHHAEQKPIGPAALAPTWIDCGCEERGKGATHGYNQGNRSGLKALKGQSLNPRA